ncbi:MAG: DUF2851 family protein [Fidelibacterota bacterium]
MTLFVRPRFPVHGVRSPGGSHFGSESELVQWWRALAPGTRFTLSNGRPVYLLDGGMSNPHDGPDIQKASLMIEGKLRRGDVECHLFERDWFAHGHHLDSRYNNVLLHVVAVAGNRRAVTQGKNEVAALLAVREEAAGPLPDTCRLDGRELHERLLEGLVPLAYGRWLDRVRILREGFRSLGRPDEVFYVQSFWALGLKGNERPFSHLALKTPLSELRSLRTGEEIAVALLVRGGFTERQHIPFPPLFKSSPWVRRGLRPHAYPERRIHFGAALVWALIQGWKPWERRFDATVENLNKVFSRSALPGPGWCGEWVGNVILPCQEAWNQVQGGGGDEALFTRWFHIDLGYAYGQLTRRFGSHVSPGDLSNFGIQQGLLSLVDRYCKLDLCRVCPLRD